MTTITGFTQVNPVYWGGHTQVNPFPLIKHWPAFLHGFGLQGA